jgi:hypothetical protein
MPSAEADALLSSANGSSAALEQSLGLPQGFLDSNELVRIDISNPREFNLRIPSGNEAGANGLWIPGGRLPNGNSEAVIDAGAISPTQYTVTPLNLVPGE